MSHPSNIFTYTCCKVTALIFLSALLSISLLGCLGATQTLRYPSTSPDPKIQDSGPREEVDVSDIPDAIPRVEPITSAGNRSPYTVLGKTYVINFNSIGFVQEGLSSWYGKKFHGRKTSNGEIYDMYGMTAAHKTLPIPTFLRVSNLDNGRVVVVRVNDRGPFHKDRILDLSYTAAKKLGFHKKGTAPVRIEVIDPNQNTPAVVGNQMPSNTPIPSHGGKEPKAPRPVHPAGYALAENTYLQVGAFSQIEGAHRMANQIRTLTLHRVFVETPPSIGLFRVFVGPIDTNLTLYELRGVLQQNGLSTGHTVER